MILHALRRSTVLAMLVAISVGCSEQGPILIGLAGPISEDRGLSMRRGAELAVMEINSNGGIRGRELQLVVKDDSASTEGAVRVASELYDAGVVAVLGHLTSGATTAAATVYNTGDDPVVEISPTASSPAVALAGDFTFRVCPSDIAHGARLANWARVELGAETAAILYEDDEYGRGIAAAFSANFRELGGTIVTDDPYLEELPSFEPPLRILRGLGGADVLLLAGTSAAATRIIPTLDTVGLDIQIIAGDELVGLERTGVSAVGVLVSNHYLPDRPGDANDDFVEAFQAAYNRVPDNRAAGAYDIVHLLREAIENVGTERRDIRDYVAAVGRDSPSFEGVTGAIGFDDNGDVIGKPVIIGVVATTGIVTVRGQ